MLFWQAAGCRLSSNDLKQLSQATAGDIRSAANTLQTWHITTRHGTARQLPSLLRTHSGSEQTVPIFHALGKVKKNIPMVLARYRHGLCPEGLCPDGLCPDGLCPDRLCPDGVAGVWPIDYGPIGYSATTDQNRPKLVGFGGLPGCGLLEVGLGFWVQEWGRGFGYRSGVEGLDTGVGRGVWWTQVLYGKLQRGEGDDGDKLSAEQLIEHA